MGLLDFVVNTILVLLVIRFFLADYTYYGFSPFLQTVYQITDFFCKPIRSLLGTQSPGMERVVPWIAVGLILLVRGLWFAFLNLSQKDSGFALDGTASIVAVHAVAASCLQFVDMIYLLTVALLLSSVLVAKAGVAFHSSAGYQAFQQSTFRVFQITQGYIRTHDLWRLFAGSVIWLAAVHFVISSLLTFGVFEGYGQLFGREALFQIQTVSSILQIYYFVLIVAIIISWVSSDPHNPVVAVVRALAEPYLRMFRKLCPWARVGMLDFSPILAFFALLFAQQILAGIAMSVSTL
ncbi:MAG: YggT family protein [bacterium]